MTIALETSPIALDPEDRAGTIQFMFRALTQTALTVFLLLLALATLEFVAYALQLGQDGLQGNAQSSRLISEVAGANFGIFLHMITGAVITALAPLQLIPALRRRVPILHRWSGRVLVGLAVITSLGGLTYIALNGTIGGLHMSLAFAIYGLLMLVCAQQTYSHARAKNWATHRDWALRLFFLAIGSWLYRVHYAIWVPSTNSAGMTSDFTGWFDQINLWAFFVPYLLLLEIALRAQGRGFFARNAAP